MMPLMISARQPSSTVISIITYQECDVPTELSSMLKMARFFGCECDVFGRKVVPFLDVGPSIDGCGDMDCLPFVHTYVIFNVTPRLFTHVTLIDM